MKILFSVGLSIIVAASSLLVERVPQETHAARENTAAVPIYNEILEGLDTDETPEIEPILMGRDELLPEHSKAISQVLSLLPEGCSEQLENLYIRYDNPEQRGLAGKSTAIISGNVPPDEFRALLIHEILGHVTDLGCLQGNPTSELSVFKDGEDLFYIDDPSVLFYEISWETEFKRKPGATERDFVTGYAFKADAFEDLAESVTFYLLHRETFVEKAKRSPMLREKLAWIETHMFPLREEVAEDKLRTGGIPWDATKLPYTWKE